MGDNRTQSKAMTELRRRLDAWRSSHRAPTPIPDELWDKAVDLAGDHGLYRTARDLHLDYGALKKRAEARACNPAAASGPQFLELLVPTAAAPTIAECALEVESASGAKMRIAMKNIPPAGLASILREFAA
jgi:hypothetical protein